MGSSRKRTLGLVISAMPMLARLACREAKISSASASQWSEQLQRQHLHKVISMQMQTQPLLLSLVRHIPHHTQVIAM